MAVLGLSCGMWDLPCVMGIFHYGKWILYLRCKGSVVVKNLPCDAKDMGSIPGQGTKIPHATEQLSLCATTTEPHILKFKANGEREMIYYRPHKHHRCLQIIYLSPEGKKETS